MAEQQQRRRDRDRGRGRGRDREEDSSGLESTTVGISRTSKTVKGGRNLSFSALVVVGDRQGKVGIGYGKGAGVPVGIEKTQKDAKKQLFAVNLNGGTIPHQVTGRYKSSKVRLIPAAPGTGVIAGGTVRAVLEMAGVNDCLTKAYGSTNKLNLCKAVIAGLKDLRTRQETARLRGVEITSSEVDEILEANRKFMIEAEKTAPAPKAKQTKKPKKKAEAKADDDQAKPEQAEEAKAEEPVTATAVAEPPAEPQQAEQPAAEAAPEAKSDEAPAPEAASEAPADESEPKKD